MVVEWVNAALLDAPSNGAEAEGPDEPVIVVSSPPKPWGSASHAGNADMDDFAPSPRPALEQGAPPAHGTITLSRSRMTRATLGHLDIDSFNNKFGTLTVSGKGRNGLGRGLGGRMLKDESCFALSELEESDEVF